jgi:hypothetical protein
MSPTEEYQQGRLARALAGWSEELAAGRSWTEVEAEILSCCEDRVDSLTGLLLEAERARSSALGATQRRSTSHGVRRAVVTARQRRDFQPDRVLASVSGIGQQS